MSIVGGVFLIGGEGLWFNWGEGLWFNWGQVGGWQKKFPYIDFEQTMRLVDTFTSTSNRFFIRVFMKTSTKPSGGYLFLVQMDVWA